MVFKRDSSKSDKQCLMESMDTAGTWRTSSTTLIDLRKKPRYDTQLPGEAVSEKGDRAYILITNVSTSGVRIEGSGQHLISILPDLGHDGEHTPTELQICFTVPGPLNQSSDIKARCHSVYVIHDELYSFKIGLKLITFDEGKDIFKKYISSHASTS